MPQTNTTYNPKPGDFSQATFWDTDLSNVDWGCHADFVIERVFGYGTEDEQQRVAELYGWKRLQQFSNEFIPNDFNRRAMSNLKKAVAHAAL